MPPAFPVKLPQIMYEFTWNGSTFTDKSQWPMDSNLFVYSMNWGGAAAHGDYVFGWKNNLNWRWTMPATSTKDCTKAGIHKHTSPQYNACTKQQMVPVTVDGWIKALPLGNKAVKA